MLEDNSEILVGVIYELNDDGETVYKDIQETVRITPIDKIVIETDSPVLPPEPFEKHSRNNSLYLNYIVKKIAEIKDLSEEEAVKNTTQMYIKYMELIKNYKLEDIQ